MRALALFRPSFQATATTFSHLDALKTALLPQTRRRLDLQRIDRTYRIAKSIERCAADLQSPAAEAELQRVQQWVSRRNMSISYDYQGQGFELTHLAPVNEKIQRARLHVRSCAVEKMDHPALRGSLYFHELKDLEQHVNITYPKNAPRFVKDIYRKNVENELLDPRNPLGLPLQAPIFQMLVEINGKFQAELHCRFGDVNLVNVREMVPGKDGRLDVGWRLNGLKFPRIVQAAFFSVCQNDLQLGEQSLGLLHRLAYLGGRVEQLQFLLRMYAYFAPELPSP